MMHELGRLGIQSKAVIDLFIEFYVEQNNQLRFNRRLQNCNQVDLCPF